MSGRLHRVQADYRHDQLPSITIGLYEAFMARGEAGHDALLAYMHLLYTYRRQNTNQVWATQSYLMKGLRMGRNKVTAARGLLKEIGIAQSVDVRDPVTRRITGHYIKLNLLPNPGKAILPESGTVVSTVPESHTTGKPQGGVSRQMLEEVTEMLEEGKEKGEEPRPSSLLTRIKEVAKKKEIPLSFLSMRAKSMKDPAFGKGAAHTIPLVTFAKSIRELRTRTERQTGTFSARGLTASKPIRERPLTLRRTTRSIAGSSPIQTCGSTNALRRWNAEEREGSTGKTASWLMKATRA